MSHRPGLAVFIGLLTGGGLLAGCSGPERPMVRNDAAEPRSCEAAVAMAFPDNRQGTLAAYRSAITQSASLEELARRKAFDGSILRFDCAPADVLAVGREIPQLGRAVPGAPADVADSAVCRHSTGNAPTTKNCDGTTPTWPATRRSPTAASTSTTRPCTRPAHRDTGDAWPTGQPHGWEQRPRRCCWPRRRPRCRPTPAAPTEPGPSSPAWNRRCPASPLLPCSAATGRSTCRS